jgi:hypothetical protein
MPMAKNKQPAAGLNSRSVSLVARHCAVWVQLKNITLASGDNPQASVTSSITGNVITLETKSNRCLELLAVPAKCHHPTQFVDLHVAFRQEIRVTGTKELIESSNVKITYLEPQKHGSQSRVFETWHFDYDPEQDAHPVFHAQLTHDHVLNGPSPRDFAVPHRRPDPRDAPRIPCPPMNLASLAELIVFDHYSSRAGQLDTPEWTRIAAGIPKLPLARFEKLGWTHAPQLRAWYPPATA